MISLHVVLFGLLFWLPISLAPIIALEKNGINPKQHGWGIPLSVLLFVGDYASWMAMHLPDIIKAPIYLSRITAWMKQLLKSGAIWKELCLVFGQPGFVKWLLRSLISAGIQGARLGSTAAIGFGLLAYFCGFLSAPGERYKLFVPVQALGGFIGAYQTLLSSGAQAYVALYEKNYPEKAKPPASTSEASTHTDIAFSAPVPVSAPVSAPVSDKIGRAHV
jgi:hypothetical protein